MLKVIIPENPSETKLMLNGQNILPDLHVAELRMELVGNGLPTLCLVIRAFEVEAEVSTKNIDIAIKRAFGSLPDDEHPNVTTEVSPEESDLCGLCGLPGANKIPSPMLWPGQRSPNGPFVHDYCENAETSRAHANISQAQRDAFLLDIIHKG